MSFFDRYHLTRNARCNLCVGIDPTPDAMAKWGLENSATGLRAFGTAILDAAAGVAAVVKPQVAYFERFGAEGYAALTDIIRDARERGFLVIADAKRGDIGSTMDAYAQAWFGASAPMQTDAVTANAYLGLGSLEPLLQRAADSGGYVFVVVRSSNPEGSSLQSLGSPPVWHHLLDDILQWSDRYNSRTVGAVVGATVPAELAQALRHLPDALFLAPGIGSQGASRDDLAGINGLDRVLVSASRSIGEKGPEVAALRQAMIGAKAA